MRSKKLGVEVPMRLKKRKDFEVPGGGGEFLRALGPELHPAHLKASSFDELIAFIFEIHLISPLNCLLSAMALPQSAYKDREFLAVIGDEVSSYGPEHRHDCSICPGINRSNDLE